MRIKSVTMENFRSFVSETVDFETGMTVLVGANGTGKTNVLDAIGTFFGNRTMSEGDFNADSTEMKITIEFVDPISAHKFKRIERTFVKGENSTKWNLKNLHDGEDDAMEPTKSFMARLEKNIITIPAMRDTVNEATDSKNAVFGKLLVAAHNTEKSSEYERLKDGLFQKNEEYLGAVKNDYDELLKEMGSELQDAGQKLELYVELINDNILKHTAIIKINEGGATMPVTRIGHGSQRMLLYAMINRLAKTAGDDDSNYILIIDEPDIYQSPSRSSAFYRSLKRISEKHQVICVTHSERFVTIHDVSNIRLFRYCKKNGKLKVCVGQVSSKNLAKIVGKDIDHKLDVLNRSDGAKSALFAGLVVLVEGPADKAALEIVDERMKKKPNVLQNKNDGSDDDKLYFDSSGIQIVACEGIGSIPYTYNIYDELGIPMYVVWDMDYKNPKSGEKKMYTNKEICGCLGMDSVPDVRGRHIDICEKYTWFENRIEDILACDILGKEKVRPANVNAVIDSVYDKDLSGRHHMEDIVESIHNLRQKIIHERD